MYLSLKEQVLTLKFHHFSNPLMLAYVKQMRQIKMNTLAFTDMVNLVKSLSKQFPKDQDLLLKPISDQRIDDLLSQSFIFGDSVYPELWYQLPQPPVMIFFRGNLSLLKRPKVSVVGSRKISPYPKQVTEDLVKVLSRAGFVSVSGMAKGIDQVVHETSIKAKTKASTIAIIATGLNKVYPLDHKDLQARLAKDHLLLSEFLPDSPPRKHHFIMRNRLVAGISPVTVVMEAAHKSGSLITANYALDYNREVYALPGRISDPGSQGCNELIAAGAYPYLSSQSFLHEVMKLQAYQYGDNRMQSL